jgi:glyoxylase-like metal-dependent hydrolase (beta-lactamase superfamily II)
VSIEQPPPGSKRPNEPMLAALVLAGDQQKEAIKIADRIFMAKDISNAYLVTTDDGDIMVNTGFMDTANVERNKGLFTPERTGPLRYIVLTQAHPDHYGGVPAFQEADTKIVAGKKFCDTWQYFHDLGPYLQRRTAKLWASTIKRGGNPKPPPKVEPDITVDDTYTFPVGDRMFTVIATPGGESLDSICVWLPDEKIVFTGNLFGPVFLAMPNLSTTRGDKPRLVANYLQSLDRVRKLDAELLITGHGDPIVGRTTIRASLDKMHDAVSYVKDAVIAGMNAGRSVYELMREITLPEHLTIGQSHGKVSWAVRAIWDEHSGWFYYEDSTPALYGVPRSSVDADLLELAGGADNLASRARDKLYMDRPVEAIHLLDIALSTEPISAMALATKKDALTRLLEVSNGTNLSETMWLKSEIAEVESTILAISSGATDR